MKKKLRWAAALVVAVLIVASAALAWVIEFGTTEERIAVGFYVDKVPGLGSLVGKPLANGAPFRRRQAREKLLQEAQSAVVARLRDPESARFRGLHVDDPALGPDSTFMTVCGEVNAKNGLGGYIGFEPFRYRGGKEPDLLLFSEDPKLFEIVAMECLPGKAPPVR